jgi:pimeloyl-ACP methyl ester carboxylesterase
MKQSIESRELFVLDGQDVIVRGTYHKTYNCRFGDQSNQYGQDRVGILILNSMSPTRAAHGDSAVYWADSFAKRGYPTFRIDLPGFGDSAGDPQPQLVDFINQGGYAPSVAAKIRELLIRFGLSGIVLAGQCAGSVSALYSAAAACADCKGLILMDPYFFLPRIAKADNAQERNIPSNNTNGRLNHLDVPRGTPPPENANLPLLHRWREVTSRGMPVLVLRPPSRKSDVTKLIAGDFDYFKYLLELAHPGSRVDIKMMDGADPSFAGRLGRVMVRQHIEQWMNYCFPVITNQQCAATFSS